MIPGLLYGASSYGELCSDLRARGIAAVAVPMEWWHWIPCLGGRSARPILERIDFAVDHVLAKGAEAEIPWPSYTLADFVGDMLSNPGGVMKVGGSSDPADYPEDVQPRGEDFSAEARSRRGGTAANPAGVSLVGHSAGGWIARVFLSERAYGGRAYRGAERVGALVTLGTPHASAPSVAYKSIEWLEREEESYTAKVRCLAVGSTGIKGEAASDFSKGSYTFCGARDVGDADGDGVTPLFSAHGMRGAETLALEGVTHAGDYPSIGPTAELAEARAAGQPWYGSPSALERWAPWLLGRDAA